MVSEMSRLHNRICIFYGRAHRPRRLAQCNDPGRWQHLAEDLLREILQLHPGRSILERHCWETTQRPRPTITPDNHDNDHVVTAGQVPGGWCFGEKTNALVAAISKALFPAIITIILH